MSDPQHLRLVEALIFAATKPIEESDLVKRLPEDVDVRTVLEDLMQLYADKGVNLVRRGDGWAFRTAPDLGSILGKEVVVSRKLPRAAAETLAILAYQKGGEGVTRAEIEEIRGVSVSQGTLDLLFEAGWVRPMGRKEAPGRPMLWGTTEAFLDHFGLKSLEDLPGIDELKASGLLDATPAIAYAARAPEEPVPGEEPIEPLNAGENDVEGEEALERAALADEMLNTPAGEAAVSDGETGESEGEEDDSDEESDEDEDEEDDEDEDEDLDEDEDEDGFDDDDEDDESEDEDAEDRDDSDTESAAAEK